MTTALLIIHGLLAVVLIGAISHQTLSVWWPARTRTGTFLNSVRAVQPSSYANAVTLLFAITFVLGGLVYPAYRLNVRSFLHDNRLIWAEGMFELKEHFAAIGLGMLPVYWSFWRKPLSNEDARTRAIITTMLAIIAWWGFLVGHILNNIRGFGA